MGYGIVVLEMCFLKFWSGVQASYCFNRFLSMVVAVNCAFCFCRKWLGKHTQEGLLVSAEGMRNALNINKIPHEVCFTEDNASKYMSYIKVIQLFFCLFVSIIILLRKLYVAINANFSWYMLLFVLAWFSNDTHTYNCATDKCDFQSSPLKSSDDHSSNVEI